jgi:thiamine pyrophosphate-dependent acetolactate synthase large subunit-like protein
LRGGVVFVDLPEDIEIKKMRKEKRPDIKNMIPRR